MNQCGLCGELVELEHMTAHHHAAHPSATPTALYEGDNDESAKPRPMAPPPAFDLDDLDPYGAAAVEDLAAAIARRLAPMVGYTLPVELHVPIADRAGASFSLLLSDRDNVRLGVLIQHDGLHFTLTAFGGRQFASWHFGIGPTP